MLDALIEGKADPAAMADLAKRRMRSKIPALTEALTGRFTPVIGGELTAAERLAEITGLGQVPAQVIIAEIGLDMTRFPTAGHLVSWANLCPRTIQSGPVQRGGKTGKGNPYLKGVLGEAAAVAAGRTLSSESAIGASSSAGASSKRSSLSPARSWSSSGICWPIRPRASMISAAITTLAASTSTADFATTSPNLRRSATASLSNQRPDRTDPTSDGSRSLQPQIQYVKQSVVRCFTRSRHKPGQQTPSARVNAPSAGTMQDAFFAPSSGVGA